MSEFENADNRQDKWRFRESLPSMAVMVCCYIVGPYIWPYEEKDRGLGAFIALAILCLGWCVFGISYRLITGEYIEDKFETKRSEAAAGKD